MTYIYNHIPGIITGFEHTGSFSDLRLDLDFACYILSWRNIGPCYWPTKVSMDGFWPLQKEPLGYIGMNGHSGPLIKASGRAEYEVLVPIYGLTVRDLVTSVLFWTLTTAVDRKFIAKLAPWPYGHYNEAVFDGLDDIIDASETGDDESAAITRVKGKATAQCVGNTAGLVKDGRMWNETEKRWNGPTVRIQRAGIRSQGKQKEESHIGGTSQTESEVRDHIGGRIKRGTSSAIGSALVPARITPVSPPAQATAQTPIQSSAPVPAIPPSQTPTYEDFINVDELLLPQTIHLSEDLRWTEHSSSGDNSRWCYGNAMRVVKLWPYRHQFITQCFLEAMLRIGLSYQDCQIIDLEFTTGVRFHWHHLHGTFDHTPNLSLSDLRKVIGHCLKPSKGLGFCLNIDEGQTRIARMTAVLDQAAVQLDQGQDQMLVAFDFYEYCQKALNRNLNRTGDAAVIKLYRRIGCLHGPPLMEIQEVGHDLGYVRTTKTLDFLKSFLISNSPSLSVATCSHLALVLKLLEILELRCHGGQSLYVSLCRLLVDNKPLTIPFHTSNCRMNGQRHPFNTVVIFCLTSSRVITWIFHWFFALANVTFTGGRGSLHDLFRIPPMVLPQEGAGTAWVWFSALVNDTFAGGRESLRDLFAMILPQEGKQGEESIHIPLMILSQEDEQAGGEYCEKGDSLCPAVVPAPAVGVLAGATTGKTVGVLAGATTGQDSRSVSGSNNEQDGRSGCDGIRLHDDELMIYATLVTYPRPKKRQEQFSADQYLHFTNFCQLCKSKISTSICGNFQQDCNAIKLELPTWVRSFKFTTACRRLGPMASAV
ncbi:uncharacterized protein F5147DRAFT_661019 [Suillus discolor]|uniref:Uncharacterized protein n=1 Tax=Suillus discolor TaxID=1912936 RepID=A0A9P7JKW2_9AGAM|nr:uncharacterized protein F5147DRAFT_661019 [Suillus discolor]KAG2081013.1 hypothetical protein F5147DRAFT_661019 [Suillus discolor]